MISGKRGRWALAAEKCLLYSLSLAFLIFGACRLVDVDCSERDASCTQLLYARLLPNSLSSTFNGLQSVRIAGSASANLAWTAASSGAPVYHVYRATSAGGQDFNTASATFTDVTAGTVAGLSTADNYYFVMRALGGGQVAAGEAVEKSAMMKGLARYYTGSQLSATIGGPALIVGGGAPTFGLGSDGAAAASFQFDTTSDYLSAATAGLPMADSSRSLCAWVAPASLPGNAVFLAYGTGAANQGLGLALVGTTDVRFFFWTGLDFDVPYTLVVGEWIHICATYGAPNATVYVNAALRGSTGGVPTQNTGAGNLRLGRNLIDFDFYVGRIADIRIYSRELSAQEVSRVYTGN